VLVVGPRLATPLAREPIFICFDGSALARHAVAVAADLLAGREAIVATVLPTVDDSDVLRATLPWPVGSDTEDRLARIDREEGAGPVKRAAAGTRAAAGAGLTARALPISATDVSVEEEDNPGRRLLRAAASEQAACIVVGHRPSVTHLESMAYGLIRHADRPVLVVPAPSSA
jgi:nucleotide-binding universal stress UspA family protein